MATDYEKRLKIPIEGSSTVLYSQFYEKLTNGYTRIVIGGRGPYVEISEEQIIKDNISVPEDQKWRFDPRYSYVYYREYRSNKGKAKIYHQMKTVDYADYKIGYYYISPFELRFENGERIIEELNSAKE